jgi:hypothetical protein
MRTHPTQPRLLIPRRAVGRNVLLRRLHGLRLAVGRFARVRATTDADRRWAARVLDDLDRLAVAAALPDEEHRR